MIPDKIPSYTKNNEFKKFETNIVSEFESAIDVLFSNFQNKLKPKFFPIFENDSALYELLTEVFRFYAELEPQEKKLLLDALETISLPTETIRSPMTATAAALSPSIVIMLYQ